MIFILYICLFWLLCLLLLMSWKLPLFKKTWHEPYFLDIPVVIESDDWGPSGDFHAIRLNKLLTTLSKHLDSTNRMAILTANIVLAVPNIEQINKTQDGTYSRINLDCFPEIYTSMLTGIEYGTFVPQLHGMEHLNGSAFAQLCKQQDPRTEQAQATSSWWDWETLDSPLQGHYVDGSNLPTKPISRIEANQTINLATKIFQQLFNHPSVSTVAPCYLWNNEIEYEWHKQNIKIIQTAGYRCTGRDSTGMYIQNPSIIRVGDKNEFGQTYLVRNVMYEPVDGKNTPETAYQEAISAYKQAQAITISTHRYNYTRTEKQCNDSLTGLNNLLSKITKLSNIRFLSSPELGSAIRSPDQIIINHFNNTQWKSVKTLTGASKISAFLYRLYYRHPKLVLASYFTGLIIPAWIICKTRTLRM